VHLIVFIINYITMHGPLNVEFASFVEPRVCHFILSGRAVVTDVYSDNEIHVCLLENNI